MWGRGILAEEQEWEHLERLLDSSGQPGRDLDGGWWDVRLGVWMSTAYLAFDVLRQEEIRREKVKMVVGFSIWANHDGERRKGKSGEEDQL